MPLILVLSRLSIRTVYSSSNRSILPINGVVTSKSSLRAGVKFGSVYDAYCRDHSRLQIF